MRVVTQIPPSCVSMVASVEDACNAAVASMYREFEEAADWPCCVRCARLQQEGSVLAPHQSQTLEQLETDELEDDALAELAAGSWGQQTVGSTRPIWIRNAETLLRTRRGHGLELACFQAAAKRHTGADPDARVEVTAARNEQGEVIPGFRAYVRHSPHHQKPERQGGIDDPIEDALRNACNCVVTRAG